MDECFNRKRLSGVTLIEIVVVLAIALISLGLALPMMNDYLARQQLKQVTANITTYIQSARNMSASTECQSVVAFQRAKAGIEVTVSLEKDNLLKGCSLWFESAGFNNQNEITIRRGNIANAQIRQNTSLTFQGVSGSLRSLGKAQLELSTRGKIAKLNLDGIGNGVLEYVQ